MNEQNQEKYQINEVDSCPADGVSNWKSSLSFVLEIVKTVIISLAIILPIRYFLIQPFLVDGASMQPNFHDNDYLIVNEISYKFNNPKRGEVVVFKNPDNTKQYFIKRVIATPGESIKIDGGRVFIKEVDSDEFKEISETEYLPADLQTFGDGREIILESDEYFVMGDNRNNSRDSRIFGPLKRDLIVGRVWLRGFPFDRMSVFNFDNYKFF